MNSLYLKLLPPHLSDTVKLVNNYFGTIHFETTILAFERDTENNIIHVARC